jgi:hypothetical protein
MKKHIKAQKKLHRIAFRIYQDLVNQLNPIPKSYMDEFDVLYRVLTQQKDDKNKVYTYMSWKYFVYQKGKSVNSMSLGTRAHSPLPGDQGLLLEQWQLMEMQMMGIL